MVDAEDIHAADTARASPSGFSYPDSFNWMIYRWLRHFFLDAKPGDTSQTETFVISNEAGGTRVSPVGDAPSLAKLLDTETKLSESSSRLIFLSYPETWSIDREILDLLAARYRLPPGHLYKHLYHRGSWTDRQCPPSRYDERFFFDDVSRPRDLILPSEGYLEFSRSCHTALLSVFRIEVNGPLDEAQGHHPTAATEIIIVLCRGLYSMTSHFAPAAHLTGEDKYVRMMDSLGPTATRSAESSILEYVLPFVKMLALEYTDQVDSFNERLKDLTKGDLNEANMDRYWTALVELRDSVFGGRSGLLKFPESTVRDLHLADYDMILAAIDRLSQDFHNRMSQRVAWMSVSESKHSIKEAEAVRHLTQLAFFFIPLTFVTSCFGMNLDLLSSGSGKLWAFFATASCTTAAVLLLSSCYPLLLDRMKKIGRAFVNWALALRVIFKLANYLPRDAAWMLLLSLRHPLIIHRFLTNIDLPKRLLTYDTGTMAYRTTSELSAFWNHKGESIFHYFAGITRR